MCGGSWFAAHAVRGMGAPENDGVSVDCGVTAFVGDQVRRSPEWRVRPSCKPVVAMMHRAMLVAPGRRGGRGHGCDASTRQGVVRRFEPLRMAEILRAGLTPPYEWRELVKQLDDVAPSQMPLVALAVRQSASCSPWKQAPSLTRFGAKSKLLPSAILFIPWFRKWARLLLD